jgi:ribosomal protein S18 acetylase RimI-like enzyme
MHIRPASADDVPQVLPMVGKLAALHESWDQQRYPYLANTEQRYDQWLRAHAADPRSVFLVAEANSSKLAGFAVATVETNIPIYSLAEYGYLHDVWVEEDYRHEGLGRQLVMRVIERLKEMGVRQVRLETAALNDVAREVFLKCGFRLSTIEMQLDL